VYNVYDEKREPLSSLCLCIQKFVEKPSIPRTIKPPAQQNSTNALSNTTAGDEQYRDHERAHNFVRCYKPN
jgi:hypothetical protein